MRVRDSIVLTEVSILWARGYPHVQQHRKNMQLEEGRRKKMMIKMMMKVKMMMMKVKRNEDEEG